MHTLTWPWLLTVNYYYSMKPFTSPYNIHTLDFQTYIEYDIAMDGIRFKECESKM